jgi:hypothetical protein
LFGGKGETQTDFFFSFLNIVNSILKSGFFTPSCKKTFKFVNT